MTYEETRSEVYDYIYNYQTATVSEIVGDLDKNANSVYGVCKHLVWDGYIERDAPGILRHHIRLTPPASAKPLSGCRPLI
jgi:DNA-binding IclR family transcriptional regulator